MRCTICLKKIKYPPLYFFVQPGKMKYWQPSNRNGMRTWKEARKKKQEYWGLICFPETFFPGRMK